VRQTCRTRIVGGGRVKQPRQIEAYSAAKSRCGAEGGQGTGRSRAGRCRGPVLYPRRARLIERQLEALLKPLKGPGRRLLRPRYPAPANPGELALSEFIKFFIQERDAHLDNAVSSESTPAHVLALAHSAANDAIDGRFNEGR